MPSRKVNQWPPGSMTMWLYLQPQDVQDAVCTLVGHGVDLKKLRPLLVKRKRGRKKKRGRAVRKELGRPIKWTDEIRGGLLNLVMDQRKGIKAGSTDKGALEVLLREYAQESGITGKVGQDGFIRARLKSWQNQVSIARKRIQKLP